MRDSRWFLVALLGALVGVAAGCAGSGEAREAERAFRQEFRMAFEQYRQYEMDKALALARGEEGRWAYGFARGQEGEMQALNVARENCQQQRARYGVEASCRVYALGNEITGDPALVRELPEE